VNCTSRMEAWWVAGVIVATLARVAVADLGTITFAQDMPCIWELDEGQPTSSGHADADLPVEFRVSASCSCGCQDLKYTWNFGDGTSAEGSPVTHTYGAKAGVRNVSVTAECLKDPPHTGKKGCGATAPGGVVVYVISGIQIDWIGQADEPHRLCFNTYPWCEAHALPDGLPEQSSDKIDWHLQVYTKHIKRANQHVTDMTLPNDDWPECNAGWGSGTINASIDGTLVEGQNDELVTGANSWISVDAEVLKFFDGEDDDSQNPSDDPNWYYYYTDALQNGPHFYDPDPPQGFEYGYVDASSLPVFIFICPEANDTHLRVVEDKYMNCFDRVVRHEAWHKSHAEHNYAEHGAMDIPDIDDPDEDGVCSGGCMCWGWEGVYGTDPEDNRTYGVCDDHEWIAREHEPHPDRTSIDWAHPGLQWE